MHGASTVFTRRGTEITGLHVVSRKEALSGSGWKTLGAKQQDLVKGLALFQLALREPNWMDFQTALCLVEPYVPRVFYEEIKITRESRNWTRAGWAYAGLVNNLLQSAKVVVWCSDKDLRLRPGLFCPDWEVAVYAMTAMDRQRVCKKPGCGERFIPDSESHEYCCQKHQNADAQARWKVAHPEQAKEQARRAKEKARRTKKARESLH